MNDINKKIESLLQEGQLFLQNLNRVVADTEKVVKKNGGVTKLYIKACLVLAAIVTVFELISVFGEKFAEFIFR